MTTICKNNFHKHLIKASKPLSYKIDEENKAIEVYFKEVQYDTITGEPSEKVVSCKVRDTSSNNILMDRELSFYLVFFKYVNKLNNRSFNELDKSYTYILNKNRKNALYILKAFFINNVGMTTENSLRYIDKIASELD